MEEDVEHPSRRRPLRRGRHYGLTAQLVGSVTTICLIVLIGSSTATYRAIHSILRIEAEKHAVQQLRQAEVGIQSMVHDIRKALVIMQADSRFSDFVEKEAAEQLESVQIDIDLVKSVSEVLSYYDFIDSIGIFSERGESFFISSSHNPKGYNGAKGSRYYETAEYRQALDNPAELRWDSGANPPRLAPLISGLFTAAAPVISIHKGVFSHVNRRRAVVVLNIREHHLVQHYSELSNRYNRERVYVVTDSGNTVPVEVDVPSSAIQAAMTWLTASDGQAVGTLTFSDQSERMIMVLCPIRGVGWTLVREVPLVEISRAISPLRRIVLVSFVASMLVILAFSSLWMRTALRPIRNLAIAMQDVGRGRLGTRLERIPRNEIGELINHFNAMSENIFDLVARNGEIERQKRIQEIRALQSRINPHFLYNTLNTIKYMAVASDSPRIADALTLLGKSIRPVFASEEVTHSLEDEVEFLRNYVEIYNLRYGISIPLDTRVPDELSTIPILKFLLQPLVENALIHGLGDYEGRGSITVRAQREHGRVLITVADCGKGMSPNQVAAIERRLASDIDARAETRPVGLDNVNRRMMLHYGPQHSITLSSQLGRGTTVHLRLPWSHRQAQ